MELEEHLRKIFESASGANYGESTEIRTGEIRQEIDALLENEPEEIDQEQDFEKGWQDLRGGF